MSTVNSGPQGPAASWAGGRPRRPHAGLDAPSMHVIPWARSTACRRTVAITVSTCQGRGGGHLPPRVGGLRLLRAARAGRALPVPHPGQVLFAADLPRGLSQRLPGIEVEEGPL